LRGPGALRLEHDLDADELGRAAVDRAGEELAHGRRVVFVAGFAVSHDGYAGRAVHADAEELAGGVEV